MRITVALFGALALVAGCKPSVSGPNPTSGLTSQAAQDTPTPSEQAMIEKIPADLRFNRPAAPTPEEIERGTRIAEIFEHLHFGHPGPRSDSLIETLANRPLLLDDQAISQLRQVVKEGPARIGAQSSADMSLKKGVASASMNMPFELIQTAARSLEAGNGSAASMTLR